MPEHRAILIASEAGGAGETSQLPGMLMALGIAVLIAVVVVRGRRLRGRAAPAGSPRLRAEQVQQELRARATLEALMVEVQEQTRTCAAQIENRAVRLEKLIAMADERIAALHALSGATPARTPAREPVVTATVLHKPALDPLTRQVYELADAGRGSVEIARELDETIGKVDLILSLRRG